MTPNLKNLLTLAAKACGYEIDFTYPTTNGVFVKTTTMEPPAFIWWAPHLDDGDGAKMEAKLKLSVDWGHERVSSGIDGSNVGWVASYTLYEDHNNNRQAARRWASLRAAAQIGKGMSQ